jgi:hypothetical protein
MRVTYPVLDYIRKNEINHQYIRQTHIVEDYHSVLINKHRHDTTYWTELYNKQADIKHYQNRTTIDIFV